MHQIIAKSILNANHRINLYRGCEHNCIYCDARSKCYQMNHDFLDIEVKQNAIELLKEEFNKKKRKIVLSTGSMADPYMPLEKDLEYTRKVLELVYQYGHGIHIQTKSDLILRDLDLLKKINSQTKASVAMTLTTCDDELSKILEPNAPVTSKRVEALKKIAAAGIDTYVWICPLLPFINDTLDNLRGLLSYCEDAKVKGIIHFNLTLTLREGNREYFYEKLDQYFPKLRKKYEEAFQNKYLCPSPYQKYLLDFLIRFCKEHHIESDYETIEKSIFTINETPNYQQLSLFEDL